MGLMDLFEIQNKFPFDIIRRSRAAWSSGVISVCGVVGGEIESFKDIDKAVALKTTMPTNMHAES
jgi:hypothetical protein